MSTSRALILPAMDRLRVNVSRVYETNSAIFDKGQTEHIERHDVHFVRKQKPHIHTHTHKREQASKTKQKQ